MPNHLPHHLQIGLSFKDHSRGLSRNTYKLAAFRTIPLIRAWVGFCLSSLLTYSGEGETISPDVTATTKVPPGFVLIEPATFQQGSTNSETGRGSDELPHQVQITRPYLIGRTEVTNAQMLRVLKLGLERQEILVGAGRIVLAPDMGAPGWILVNLSHSDITTKEKDLIVQSGFEDHPCTGITWYGALVYANLLSIDTGIAPTINLTELSCNFSGNGFRLPTESEWEYACRAGSTAQFGSTRSVRTNMTHNDETTVKSLAESLAWFRDNSMVGKNKRSHQTATKTPNIWGLYDMHGNVSEWCWDWYGPYNTAQSSDPSGPKEGWLRIVRGGDYVRETKRIRSAKRETGVPFNEHRTRGFRIARTFGPSQTNILSQE